VARPYQAVALIAVAGVLDAAPQQPPVFPSGVGRVLVDVLVLDGRGRAVSGLTRDDFVLEEDGALQAIELFEAPDAPAVAGGARDAAPAAIPSSIAVVFDDLGLTHPEGLRARKAVAALAGSPARGDLVLLATTSAGEQWPLALQEDATSLKAAVDGLKGLDWRAAGTMPMTDAEACLIHVARDAATLARVELRYRASPAADAMRGDVERLVRSDAAAVCQRASAHARRVIETLRDACAQLAGAPGRRAAILVSSGFLRNDALPELRSLLDATRRANVTLHFLDASVLGAATFRGPEVEYGPADELRATGAAVGPVAATSGQDEGDAAVSGAAYVAEETGGRVVRRTNDLASGLAGVAADSRARYVLGYAPARPAGKAGYRTITVRLAPGVTAGRKGWTVRARRGYDPGDLGGAASARSPAPVAPSAMPASAEAVETAADSGPESLPLRLVAEAFEDSADAPGRVHCRLTARVDLRRVAFREDAGRLRARLDAAFEVSAEGGAETARVEKPVDLDLVPSSRQLRDWLSIEADLPLARGLHRARATVREPASGRVSTAEVVLDVPPAAVLRISERSLSDELERDESGRARARADGSRVFAVDTTVFLSFDVFGSGEWTSQPTFTVSASVERAGAGKPLKATVDPPSSDGRGGARGVVRFDLKNAKPGEYRFVGRVMDVRGRRGISFEEPFTLVQPQRPADAPRPVDSELAALLGKAGAYVAEYEQAFQNIVVEEEYVQRRPGSLTDGSDRRRTRADLVFVRLAGAIPWASFRDVYEVDGVAVRDHTSRLVRLFTERADSAMEKAEAILAESTRYNIGFERTVNLPTLPLLFLHPRNQARFAFERVGRAEPGRPVEVKFRELSRPTFIRNRRPDSETERDDRRLDLPADGRFWIDSRGTVVASEVALRTGSRESSATLTTRYRPEPTLAMWVPDEMHETYDIGFPGLPTSMGSSRTSEKLETVARYTNVRRFQVTTDEKARVEKEP